MFLLKFAFSKLLCYMKNFEINNSRASPGELLNFLFIFYFFLVYFFNPSKNIITSLKLIFKFIGIYTRVRQKKDSQQRQGRQHALKSG